MRGWALLCVVDAISLMGGPLQPFPGRAPPDLPSPALARFKSVLEDLGTAVNSDQTWNNRIDCARFCSISCQCSHPHLAVLPSCQASCQNCMVEGTPCGGLSSSFPSAPASLPATPPAPQKPELLKPTLLQLSAQKPELKPTLLQLSAQKPELKPVLLQLSAQRKPEQQQGKEDAEQDKELKKEQKEQGDDEGKDQQGKEQKEQQQQEQGKEQQGKEQQGKEQQGKEQGKDQEQQGKEQQGKEPKKGKKDQDESSEEEGSDEKSEKSGKKKLKTINDLEKELKKLLGNTNKPPPLVAQLQDTSAMLKSLADSVNSRGAGEGLKPGKGLTITGGGLSGVVPDTALGAKLNSVIDQLEGLVAWVRATKLQGDIDMTKSDALNRIITRAAELLQPPAKSL